MEGHTLDLWQILQLTKRMKHWLIKSILHVLKLARKCIDGRCLQFLNPAEQSFISVCTKHGQEICYDHGSTVFKKYSKCTVVIVK